VDGTNRTQFDWMESGRGQSSGSGKTKSLAGAFCVTEVKTTAQLGRLVETIELPTSVTRDVLACGLYSAVHLDRVEGTSTGAVQNAHFGHILEFGTCILVFLIRHKRSFGYIQAC
jgi:hypothetical protein